MASPLRPSGADKGGFCAARCLCVLGGGRPQDPKDGPGTPLPTRFGVSPFAAPHRLAHAHHFRRRVARGCSGLQALRLKDGKTSLRALARATQVAAIPHTCRPASVIASFFLRVPPTALDAARSLSDGCKATTCSSCPCHRRLWPRYLRRFAGRVLGRHAPPPLPRLSPLRTVPLGSCGRRRTGRQTQEHPDGKRA